MSPRWTDDEMRELIYPVADGVRHASHQPRASPVCVGTRKGKTVAQGRPVEKQESPAKQNRSGAINDQFNQTRPAGLRRSEEELLPQAPHYRRPTQCEV
jgi:hypothetical protein